jgi:DNA-binding IscR family transcriptional regulator
MDKIREQIACLRQWAGEDKSADLVNADREIADTLERLLAVYEALQHSLKMADCFSMGACQRDSLDRAEEQLSKAINAVKADE